MVQVVEEAASKSTDWRELFLTTSDTTNARRPRSDRTNAGTGHFPADGADGADGADRADRADEADGADGVDEAGGGNRLASGPSHGGSGSGKMPPPPDPHKRRKVMWTLDEDDALRNGFKKFERSNQKWSLILKEHKDSFSSVRNPTSLKDRARHLGLAPMAGGNGKGKVATDGSTDDESEA